MRWFALASCAGAVVFACSSSSSSPSTPDAGPAEGEERGACYPNATCNAGLTCLSDLCVVAPPAPPPPGTPPPPPPPPSSDAGTDSAADAAPTLSGDVQPIYTAHCAVTGCHTPASEVGGLDLSSGTAYGTTVNVVSGENPPMKRVDPGVAESSYLYLKITGRPVSGTSIQPPPTTGDVLTQQQKDAVRDWINAGAKND